MRPVPVPLVALVLVLSLSLTAPSAGSAGSETAASPVLDAMQTELARSMTALRDQPLPPYYLAYEVSDLDIALVTAAFGAVTSSDRSRTRILRVDLRVGDYALDSTHPIRDDMMARFASRFSSAALPVEDDPAALRNVLWLGTDRAYKRAVERFTRVQTQQQVKVAEDDRSDDFSHEDADSGVAAIPAFDLELAPWEAKLRRYTAPFASDGRIYQADARFTANREVRWIVTSEGTRVQSSRVAYRLMLSATTRADDGMELPRFETFFAYTPGGMPDDATVLAAVHRMMDDLAHLRDAPLVDPYTGPAILSGRASAVFFHEIFGHRVEGHRLRDEDEGQTFKKMVNQALLPRNFSVIFDPTLRRAADTDLAGWFDFDDEGVRARPVTVVRDGVLENFLMSRKPVAGFARSNGHARCQAGLTPVSRQSNLIVQVKDPVSRERLKQMLIERIKAEKKPFGLLFDDIMGGFTMTTRTTPNAFNVLPVMVYRVNPDGSEILVRGVDLIGTPLTSFSHIVAGDDRPGVFNGTCGAESGGVPVAAVSPDILVDQIEVQKKDKSQERPPILPAPGS